MVLFFAALILATRLPLAPGQLFTFDDVNLAYSIGHFDIRMSQPQPPGYPLFVRGGVNMGNGDRSGSGRRNDGWVRLSVRLAVVLGSQLAPIVVLMCLPEFFPGWFWLGMIGFLCVVGIILGAFAGKRLSRQPSSDQQTTQEDQPQQPGPR